MNADFKICSAWGARIMWSNRKQFQELDLNKDLFDVDGHYTPVPRVGQTLIGEFEKSFIKFEFVEVKRYSDPPDMFSATVKCIEQEMK